jgi:predicted transcriptional regulator
MSPSRKKASKDLVKEDATPFMDHHAVPQAAPVPVLAGKGGRPRLFDVPTVRLNLFLPEDAAKRIRHFAVEQGISPSQLVDEWARRAELDKAVARGRKAVQEGRTVDQEEAERRLCRWS